MCAYAAENLRKKWFTGEEHTKMKLNIPSGAEIILNTLEQNGYEAYVVGGCVRDSILGRCPDDWDITTSASPEQVKALFRRTVDTGLQHGTVTVLIEKEGFEVTTYRVDGDYEDGRHPKEVRFTSNLKEDLKRRDFTINAMAYHPERGLVDLFGGVNDMEKKVIRCVGDPMERFQEDALRILRAVRFSAQLGFTIEASTKEAIGALAPNLKLVSAERIQVELVKLLVSPNPDYLRVAYETGVTAEFLPEFDVCMKTDQNTPHHCYTVGEHTIEVLKGVEADKVLRLAALFHDVAKPDCRSTDEDGIDHFYEHPQVGAKKTKTILRRLKFDNATIDMVCRLVAIHDINPALTPESVRKAIQKAGLECYPVIFELKKADILAQSDYQRKEKLEALDGYHKIYDKIIKDADCLTLKDLALNGRDLIELGVKPGPQIGNILAKLLDVVIEEPEKNTKEYLTGYTLKNLFI